MNSDEDAFEAAAEIAAAMLRLHKGSWRKYPAAVAKGMIRDDRAAATLLRDALNEALLENRQ